MGLFSSSSKTYYNSTTCQLYDDDTAGLIEQTVAASVVQNRNIGNDLIANIVNGIGFKLPLSVITPSMATTLWFA